MTLNARDYAIDAGAAAKPRLIQPADLIDRPLINALPKAANDMEAPATTSLLVRRRKRLNRRTAH